MERLTYLNPLRKGPSHLYRTYTLQCPKGESQRFIDDYKVFLILGPTFVVQRMWVNEKEGGLQGGFDSIHMKTPSNRVSLLLMSSFLPSLFQTFNLSSTFLLYIDLRFTLGPFRFLVRVNVESQRLLKFLPFDQGLTIVGRKLRCVH